MTQQPDDRSKDSGKAAKNNIAQPEPFDKQDPTEPVKVSGAKEAKGASM